jgi:prepilin-type processing-associated H-X9-DG protein
MRVDAAGRPVSYPSNYGLNLGTWLVYDPRTNKGGDGAFFPNSQLKHSNFTDGLSKTLMAAEVKAYTPYFRNAPSAPATPPTQPSDICGYGGQPRMGPNLMDNSGYTEWVDGKGHQAGVTSTFTPNTAVLCDNGGRQYDVSFNSQTEGGSNTVPTYAALTSRSYHPGGVNVALMDGSVRMITDVIDLPTWRAVSTRAGNEMAQQDY